MPKVTLNKLIDESIFPAILLVVAKVVSVFVISRLLSVQFGLKRYLISYSSGINLVVIHIVTHSSLASSGLYGTCF